MTFCQTCRSIHLGRAARATRGRWSTASSWSRIWRAGSFRLFSCSTQPICRAPCLTAFGKSSGGSCLGSRLAGIGRLWAACHSCMACLRISPRFSARSGIKIFRWEITPTQFTRLNDRNILSSTTQYEIASAICIPLDFLESMKRGSSRMLSIFLQ